MDAPQFAFGPGSAWGRCLNYFLTDALNHSGSTETRRIYGSILARFFSTSTNGTAKMPEFYTREDVEHFLNLPSTSPRNPGATPTTATKNQKLSALKAFYEYAAQFTIEGSNGTPHRLYTGTPPTLGIKRGKPGKRQYALSYEELERLFSCIPNNPVGAFHRAIFAVYFWSARRRSEILRLKWGDLFQGMIVEHGTSRTVWMYRFTGKGKSQEEDVAEMPGPAIEAIMEYLKETGRLETMTPESPLFVAVYLNHGTLVKRTAVVCPTAVTNALKRYAKQAGLDESRMTLHVFRHTAATLRALAGEELRSIQRLLRHSSIATTELYLHGLMATADNGAKLLEAKFGQFGQRKL